ncbi:MAG: hypothetical protein U9N34_08630, partial [Candidatus Cloacimonadota bacterium]|nr:hypothetical protein [Candidatus Cloacimonadota bacterium]
MKWFIAITLMFNVLMASEYLSLTPSKTLKSFASQGAGIEESVYLRQTSTVTLTKDVHAKDGDWYTTQWQKYKFYFPAGTSSSSLAFICKPNASYRVHVTFIGENATINHNPLTNDSYIVNNKQTNEFLVQNIKVIELDTAMINSSNGGWIYIDVAEDSANIDSYYGDVNPALSIAATSKIDNKLLYNSWKSSVN